MLANVRSPEIRKSVRIIYDYSSDARTRELARIREDALHLEATMMAGAKREGREEGRKEGREEGREEGRKEGREEGRKEGREEGRKEGREEGKEEGRKEGKAEGVFNALKNLMISMNWSPEQAMDVLRIPQEERAAYSAMLAR